MTKKIAAVREEMLIPVMLMLVRIANDYVNAHYGVTLQYEQMQCGFTDFNEQCIKERCPFHE